MFKYLLQFILFSFLACSSHNQQDNFVSVKIEPDLNYQTKKGDFRPKVILENYRFRAVVATRKGGTCGIESGIVEFVQRSTGTNQIRSVVDANYMRGPMIKATITHDGVDSKRVEIIYEDLPDRDRGLPETDNSAKLAYTIFPDLPLIKIEYLDRLEEPDPIVDLGAPGGVKQHHRGMFADSAETQIFGQENYHKGELVCHPVTYWTSVADDPRSSWEAGPRNGGSLNYKNHFIVTVKNKFTGEGYGRVIPIHLEGVQGGARHLKLLWNTGNEFYCKPWTDKEFGKSKEKQIYNPSFVSYLFCFDKNTINAIELGKQILDGSSGLK